MLIDLSYVGDDGINMSDTGDGSTGSRQNTDCTLWGKK